MNILVITITLAFVLLIVLLAKLFLKGNFLKGTVPVSVNYHFTRRCNYQCGFCFHTAKNSSMASLEDAKNVLWQLKNEGMKKLNFAGGEPFLYPEFLGQLVQFAKQELKLESVSIVTNGSKVQEAWFDDFGQYLDIIAISIDSFDEQTNRRIGRFDGTKANQVENATKIKKFCQKHGIKFKINTVVNKYNFMEDMNSKISSLNPDRWKAFQVLLLETENKGQDAKRNAEEFKISNEEFNSFVERHKQIKALVPEPNEAMQNSYLILDENLCFLDCSKGEKKPSDSILKVGVQAALKQSGFDKKMFEKRGGHYDWTRTQPSSSACSKQLDKNLQW